MNAGRNGVGNERWRVSDAELGELLANFKRLVERGRVRVLSRAHDGLADEGISEVSLCEFIAAFTVADCAYQWTSWLHRDEGLHVHLFKPMYTDDLKSVVLYVKLFVDGDNIVVVLSSKKA